MRYVRLGKSDLEVSRLGLDCHSLGIAQRERGWDPLSYDGEIFAVRTVHAALEAGINIFHTSPDAGGSRSQSLLGKALQGRRDEVLLATRLFDENAASDVEERLVSSLRRLRTDRMDVLFVDESLSESAAVIDSLDRLRSRGVVRHFGLIVSDSDRSCRILETGLFDLAELQFDRSDKDALSPALDACSRHEIGVSIVKPLASKTLQTLVDALDPDWTGSSAVRECCIRYLLSDRRIHVVNIGMRWEHEVITNSRIVADFEPFTPAPDGPFLHAAQVV